jgi:uncharacterized protein YcbX
MEPTLARITIYPVKSLDGVDVDQATLVARGALEFDRRWAIIDASGELVNAKRTARIQTIRATYQIHPLRISLPSSDTTVTLDVESQTAGIASILSALLAMDVSLVENPEGGFPDDPDASGPTIVSTATLQEVAQWFQISLDECRRRFRANLEIADVPPFWEEQLYAKQGPIPFQIGTVDFLGQNPCQRCVVPTRDSITGIPTPMFAKTFGQERERTLPTWAPRERFDHFYRLCVNTNVSEPSIGQKIRVGDRLKK